jgi:hypothetical protein
MTIRFKRSCPAPAASSERWTTVGLVDIGFGLGGPEQFVIGPDGRLYVANFNSTDVEVYDPITGQAMNGGIFVGGGSGGLAGTTGIAFGFDGYLYVASNFTDQILRYDAHTGSFNSVVVDANSTSFIGPGFLTSVPEPASATAILSGFAGIALHFRKRKRLPQSENRLAISM